MGTALTRLGAWVLAIAALLLVGVHFLPMRSDEVAEDPRDGPRDYEDRLWSWSYDGQESSWWLDPCAGVPKPCAEPDGLSRLRAAGPLVAIAIAACLAATITAATNHTRAGGYVAAGATALLLLAALFVSFGSAAWDRHYEEGLDERRLQNGFAPTLASGFDPELAAGFWLLAAAAVAAGAAALWLIVAMDPSRIPRRRAKGPKYVFKQRERRTFESGVPEEPTDEAPDPKDLA